MSNNWYALLVGIIGCLIAGFGAYFAMHYLMVLGIMLPVIASIFHLPRTQAEPSDYEKRR